MRRRRSPRAAIDGAVLALLCLLRRLEEISAVATCHCDEADRREVGAVAAGSASCSRRRNATSRSAASKMRRTVGSAREAPSYFGRSSKSEPELPCDWSLIAPATEQRGRRLLHCERAGKAAPSAEHIYRENDCIWLARAGRCPGPTQLVVRVVRLRQLFVTGGALETNRLVGE